MSVGSEGATPFFFAADRLDIVLMRLLLELGADPLLPHFDNTTPPKRMRAAGLSTEGERPKHADSYEKPFVPHQPSEQK